MTFRITLLFLLSFLLCPLLKADPALPALFSSHMVVQRETPVQLWGWADAKERICVSFRGKVYKTRSDREGNWLVVLDSSGAGGPYELVIEGKKRIVLEDVYVGDVWLCAGQSNMLFRLRLDDEATSELPNAGRHSIKLFKIAPDTAHFPQVDFQEINWETCNQETAADFSAVAYYLGAELSKNLDQVPIGLIQSAAGSSTAEAWMSREAMEGTDYLREHLLNYRSKVVYKNPATVYNAMLHPLCKYACKGVVWYQGESNVLRASQYCNTLPAMIADWRQAFNNDTLPFFIVEIPPYNYTASQREPGKTNSAETLRAAQITTSMQDTFCELIPTSDLGDPDELHPTNKKVLGQRIARSILSWEKSRMPDISSVPADLFLPALSAVPSEGRRVKIQMEAYGGTKVYHVMHLPENWKPGKKYPVIVEYPGNGPYKNRFGDQCSGRPEDCSFGYGISGGKDYIVLSLPFIKKDHKDIQLNWWGDIEAGKAYCMEALQDVYTHFGGDSTAVILTGFSRGAIACNYLGLHDDEIAASWLAFIPFDHYDGVREWSYEGSDAVSAMERLESLNGRPQMIVSSSLSGATKAYIESTGITGQFDYLALPFRNHSDQWILRDTPERDSLREWLRNVLKAPIAKPSKYEKLRIGFVDPPQEAKPLVWWDWINGNVTKEGIKADLLDIKRVGLAGVQLFDVLLYMPEGPVRYGSEKWYEHVSYAIHIADSLGLEFHVMNCPGWSASGGPWNTPEKSMKRIVWSETTIDGGRKQKITLPFPEIKHDYFEEIAVFAVPANFTGRTIDWEKKIGFSKTILNREINSTRDDTTLVIPMHRVLNLSEKLSEKGVLSCELPVGRWTIIRFGFTTTGSTNHPAQPEGHGLECDKLDAESVKFQFYNALGTIIKNADPYLGNTFKGIVFDSFEGGFQNWTKSFPSEFERINGYDLMLYLPVLTGRIVDSRAATEAILYDFRGTIDELLVENYFKTMQELAHENKLITYSESQGGPLNPFLCNKYIDVPMNEFWLRNYTKRVPLMKQSVASAHLYNKRVIAAESFTAIPEYGKWQSTPSSLKIAGDCAFSAGINRFIFHTYIHQPYDYLKPGFTMGRYGTHFGRQCAWWPYANGWIDYITRSQFLLQQGKTVSDFGVLLSNDMRYDIPAGDIKPPLGYDLTMCYPMHLDNAKVANGVIELSELAHCKVLVLNKRSAFMTVGTLENIYRLLNDGAIIAGEPPLNPPGFKEIENSMDQFNELVDKIWGGLKVNTSKSIGKGKVFYSTNFDWIVTQADMTPDLEFIPNQNTDSLRYIHKKIDDTDIYFVTNLTSETQSVKIRMRITGKKPEIWDATTGKICDAPVYKVSNTTEIPLNLEAGGSRFIVFSDKLPSTWITKVDPDILKSVNASNLVQGKKSLKVSYSDNSIKEYRTKKCPQPMDLSKSWDVKFIEGRGAPSESMVFENLISWTEHPNENIKYYSGIAQYSKTFTLPKKYLKDEQKCILKLGEVCDVAEISINGHKPELVWRMPAELDVTDMLVVGENNITIGIANRWINRLIGDEHVEVDIPYREGSGKFTTGVIDQFPDWMRDEQRAKEENKRYTFTTWKHYTVESALKKSGLLGPVKLVVYNEFNIF